MSGPADTTNESTGSVPSSIKAERFLDILIRLCRIPSPSGSEGRVADMVLEMARNCGAVVRDDGKRSNGTVDEQGNIVLAMENGHPEKLFLSAHMDTVPVPTDIDAVVVVRENGRIGTDGSSVLGGDDKVGVAAALEMMSLCAEHPAIHRSLEVIFTVREEVGSRGSRDFDPGLISARTGFNLDGETLPFTAIRKAPRKSVYQCVVGGVSAHGALNPDDGINAILVAAKLIPLLPSGTLGENSTANIGVISGGKQTNIVPDHVSLDGEIRSFDTGEFDDIRRGIEKACRDVSDAFGVPVDVEWRPSYEGYEVKLDEECARWYTEACRKRGREPEFLSSRGGGDSNQLNAMGLRNIVFGLGMHEIHSPKEYLLEDEVIAGVELLKEIVFPGSP